MKVKTLYTCRTGWSKSMKIDAFPCHLVKNSMFRCLCFLERSLQRFTCFHVSNRITDWPWDFKDCGCFNKAWYQNTSVCASFWRGSFPFATSKYTWWIYVGWFSLFYIYPFRKSWFWTWISFQIQWWVQTGSISDLSSHMWHILFLFLWESHNGGMLLEIWAVSFSEKQTVFQSGFIFAFHRITECVRAFFKLTPSCVVGSAKGKKSMLTN